MTKVLAGREELDRLGQAPVLFDALVQEKGSVFVFRKTVRLEDPGVREQRVTPRWPHHLPGELTISLTGQAAVIALRRMGLTGPGWRGHRVRIQEARWSEPVFLGETFFTRIEVLRTRQVRGSLFLRAAFRMWKPGARGEEIETYRSEQDAIFLPGDAPGS